jgi:hypothetical protein
MRNNETTILVQKPLNPNGNHNQPSREFSTYDKRKWTQFVSELCHIDRAREKSMCKATSTYQVEYYTHVSIASTIDMGRGLILSGYENMVNIERSTKTSEMPSSVSILDPKNNEMH